MNLHPRPLTGRFLRSTVGLAASACLLAHATPASALAPGDLDPSFGDGGVRMVGLSGSGGPGVAIQHSGRIVVLGSGGDFRLAGLTPDGALDPSFGSDGKVVTGPGLAEAFDMALGPDDTIVTVGWADDPSTPGVEFAVARYLPDGTLDPGFGGDGVITTDFAPVVGRTGSDDARAVAVQPDGKIVVAGNATMFFPCPHCGRVLGSLTPTFAAARYNTDGTLDPTFGYGGLVVTPLGYGTRNPGGFVWDVALQPDGKIVVAGFHYRWTALRYNADGSLDATFGDGGVVCTTLQPSFRGPHSVELQNDGRIILVGDLAGSTEDFGVARLTPDGRFDPSFSGDGWTATDFGDRNDIASDAAVTREGNVVVAGNSQGYALARYRQDGTLDTGFGNRGLVQSNVGGFEAAVAQQDDGKIIVADGRSVARFLGGEGTLPTNDTQPPSMSSAVSPCPNDTGWNTTDPVVVTLTATEEGGSNVSSLTFEADGAQTIPPTTVASNHVSVEITREGGTTITYWATDSAGNTSAPQRAGVLIDKTPPVVTATPDRLPDRGGWYNKPVTVTFTGTGVNDSQCDMPVAYSGPDAIEVTLSGSCMDQAGHVGTATFGPFNLDDTNPAATIDGPTSRTIVTANNANLSGTASDNFAGVARVTVNFRDLLGRTVARQATCTSGCGTRTASWQVSAAGLHGRYTITAITEDVAGNVGPPSRPVTALIL